MPDKSNPIHSLVWKSVGPSGLPGDLAPPLPGVTPAAHAVIRATGVPGFDDNPPPLEYARRLLRIAAQVEHEFLLQYLYAAYTLPGGSTHPWCVPLVTIAKEEMAHFLTVQNFLRSVGEPPELAAEPPDAPSEWYPFGGTRRPLGAASLAHYIKAESPVGAALPDGVDAPDVRHVGVIYATLYWLFLKDDDVSGGPWTHFPAELFSGIGHLADGDVTGAGNQVSPADWGSTTSGPATLIIQTVVDRASAQAALARIAGQGEGLNDTSLKEPSHYERLLQIHAQSVATGAPSFAADVVSDSTLPPDDGPGLITDPVTATWAELLVVRYHILLLEIGQSFLHGPSDQIGDDNVRGLLFQGWIVDEMRHIRTLARHLASLPAKQGSPSPRAGPPFLPAKDPRPETPAAAWARHRGHIARAARIIDSLGRNAATFTGDILADDTARLDWMATNGL